MKRTSHLILTPGAFCVMLIGPCLANAEETLVPVDQHELNALVENGQGAEAFARAFEAGDVLSEFSFTADQGVGANVGESRRFTRIPRADLNGPGEWATHFPSREGGANALSCLSCHNAPYANGGGGVAANVVLDPGHSGDPKQYLERNTTSLFALSVPQRLAEEMSIELDLQRDDAQARACRNGSAVSSLSAKDVFFGTLVVTRTRVDPCVLDVDTTGIAGVDGDLVVKPFGWKGNHATLRAFTRGAAHNELGLQATELVGMQDGDFDGVINELSVGDVTALTVYMAALERPVSRLELAELGWATLSREETDAITAGKQQFAEIGCTSCHTPRMALNDPVFREPSGVKGFSEDLLPDGSVPAARGLTARTAISFDMRSDQPNNRVRLKDGRPYHMGALQTDPSGAAFAEWYSDLKRHDMGPGLADPSDPLGLGATMFLTRSLAGVGMSGPWLHDGRATTLNEAILAHGGEARAIRDTYATLPDQDRSDIVAFLENLIVFKANPTH